MKYVSTRNSNIKYSFEEIFFKGLADDGGLFIPENFYNLSKDEILKFSKLSFQEISEFIFSKYTGETFKKDELNQIINKT